jgi:hypothetical protein
LHSRFIPSFVNHYLPCTHALFPPSSIITCLALTLYSLLCFSPHQVCSGRWVQSRRFCHLLALPCRCYIY